MKAKHRREQSVLSSKHTPGIVKSFQKLPSLPVPNSAAGVVTEKNEGMLSWMVAIPTQIQRNTACSDTEYARPDCNIETATFAVTVTATVEHVTVDFNSVY